jgi:hypothetical protein
MSGRLLSFSVNLNPIIHAAGIFLACLHESMLAFFRQDSDAI